MARGRWKIPNYTTKKDFGVIPSASRHLDCFQGLYDFIHNENEKFDPQENSKPITHLLDYVTIIAKCVSEFFGKEIRLE